MDEIFVVCWIKKLQQNKPLLTKFYKNKVRKSLTDEVLQSLSKLDKKKFDKFWLKFIKTSQKLDTIWQKLDKDGGWWNSKFDRDKIWQCLTMFDKVCHILSNYVKFWERNIDATG